MSGHSKWSTIKHQKAIEEITKYHTVYNNSDNPYGWVSRRNRGRF